MVRRLFRWGAGVAALGMATQATAQADGRWEGHIEIPGAPLHVKVVLEQDADAWQGAIDIPVQGAVALPLSGISVGSTTDDGQRVEFAIRGVPGHPTFQGRLEGGEIRGRFEQGGATFPFRLGRQAVALTRPQEPRRPFPYASEDVRFESGPVRLAGTLTIPAGEGPFAAVLLISGSGLQDRDQTLFGHKPFLVLADHLSRAGIAVLRVDDAGAGQSEAHPSPPTLEDSAADANAGVDFLHADVRIGTAGLIGHSEGGVVAPMLASRRDDIGFVVLLAAPGVPGDELIRRQNERIYAALDFPADRRERLLGLLDRLFAILKSDASAAAAMPEVEAIVREQMQANGVPPAEQQDAQVSAAAAQALAPAMRGLLRHDPRPALTRTRVPVLALNGERDVQVDAEQNLPAIRAALADAENTDVETHRLPGLNHLFQTAASGLPNEYGALEETMAPAVLDGIRDWILARTGR